MRGALPERCAILFINDSSFGEENSHRSNVSEKRESPLRRSREEAGAVRFAAATTSPTAPPGRPATTPEKTRPSKRPRPSRSHPGVAFCIGYHRQPEAKPLAHKKGNAELQGSPLRRRQSIGGHQAYRLFREYARAAGLAALQQHAREGEVIIRG